MLLWVWAIERPQIVDPMAEREGGSTDHQRFIESLPPQRTERRLLAVQYQLVAVTAQGGSSLSTSSTPPQREHFNCAASSTRECRRYVRKRQRIGTSTIASAP